MKLVYSALCDVCEDGAAKGRRQSSETILGYSTPCPFDTAIGDMIRALARYADAHHATYQNPIGDDCVLGEAWEGALKSVVALLNGETGRLDCGDADRACRAMYKAAGFEGEL